MSLVLDDINVDVASFERVDTSTGINRILILIDLNDVIELVGPILVASKIVEVEPVGLAALASDNADARYVSTRKLTRKELQRRRSKVCIQSALNSRSREEIYPCQRHQVVSFPKA
jgi:hypothetical protein